MSWLRIYLSCICPLNIVLFAKYNSAFILKAQQSNLNLIRALLHKYS